MNFWDISGKFAGKFRDTFGTFPGNFQNKSGFFWGISGKFNRLATRVYLSCHGSRALALATAHLSFVSLTFSDQHAGDEGHEGNEGHEGHEEGHEAPRNEESRGGGTSDEGHEGHEGDEGRERR